MLSKFLYGKTETIKMAFKFILMVLLCILVILLLFCITSFTLCKFDFSYTILPSLTTVILGIGAALSSFVISGIHKQNGLFWGFFVGLIITLCLLIISASLNYFSLSFNTFVKPVIIIISGAIGGILGVNIT